MKIIELKLDHFGKFTDKSIMLNPELNIIEGKNEAGKSTIHTFIRGMFFGLETGKENLLERYKPWDFQGHYDGRLRFEEKGHIYRIERSFLKSNRYVRLFDETDGDKELEPAKEILSSLLCRMTEGAYISTVSIGQMKSQTDYGLREELRHHMEDLGMTKSMELSLSRAKEKILVKRNQMEKMVDRTVHERQQKNLSEQYQAEKELENLIAEETALLKEYNEGKEEEYRQYSDQQKKKDELKKALEDVSQEKKRLSHEKERWETEKNNYQVKLERKLARLSDDELERGVTVNGLADAARWTFAMGIIFLVLMAFCFLDRFFGDGTQGYFFAKPFIMAAAFGGLGLICIIIGGILVRRHKKRMNVYRLLTDKYLRMKEADRAVLDIDKKEKECISELAYLGQSEYSVLHEKNENLEKQMMKLEWEQEQKRKGKEQLEITMAQLKEAQEKNETLRFQICAMNKALEVMYKAAGEIQNTFGEELNKKAGKYLEKLTDGAYHRIVCEDNGKIFLSREDRTVSLEQVSRGTIEQVWLCIRIAAADCIWPEFSMPIFLDDTFAFYDDFRTKQALELLKQMNRQVIVMTCQSREKKLMEE